jgi:hypothetical protein
VDESERKECEKIICENMIKAKSSKKSMECFYKGILLIRLNKLIENLGYYHSLSVS